jgi:hypothetical protein
MATAEKMFPLSVTRPYAVQGVAPSPGLLQALTNFLTRLFGCWHLEMSRPFTRQGQTFRTCLGCGARRQFDPRTWETKGGFYRAAA